MRRISIPLCRTSGSISRSPSKLHSHKAATICAFRCIVFPTGPQHAARVSRITERARDTGSGIYSFVIRTASRLADGVGVFG